MERSNQPIIDFFRFLFTPGRQQAQNHLIGMGSIFDLSGHYFEEDEKISDEQADWLAMYSDWEAIGNDLKSALGFIENKGS